MLKYFNNIKTLEELKIEYKKLALKYHPDRQGGDLDTMKVINAEYDEVFKTVKNFHTRADGKVYQKENTEVADDFKDIIAKLIKLEGLKIDIVGCFIWVGGTTLPHKEVLKSLGFRWSRNKGLWYKSPKDYHRVSRHNHTYAEITAMFGVQASFEGKDTKKLEA